MAAITERDRGAVPGGDRDTAGASGRDDAPPARASPAPAVNRAVLRRLLTLARPYWRWLAAGGVCLASASLLGLALPWLIRGLIDGIVVARGGRGLRQTAAALVTVFALQAVFNFGQSYLLAYTGERLVADLRRRLYGHLQGSRPASSTGSAWAS